MATISARRLSRRRVSASTVVQAAFVEALQHGVLDMGCLVLDRDMLVTQLSPHGYDLGELFNGLVPLHNSLSA